jgi:hypothetical protein
MFMYVLSSFFDTVMAFTFLAFRSNGVSLNAAFRAAAGPAPPLVSLDAHIHILKLHIFTFFTHRLS